MSASIIIGYHRVSPSPQVDPLGRGLEVAASRFEQHLQILATRFSVVPLDDLVARLTVGAGARGMAAVTFDDGYEDNYAYALPILSRMGVPATVFLATDNVGHARPFWTERLAAHLCRSAGAVVPVPEELGTRLDLTSSQHLRQSYDRLRGELSGLDSRRREQLLDRLGAPGPTPPKPLTWEQIRAMRRQGVAFGAHTGSHPSLPRLSDTTARVEVEASRDAIHMRLGAAPTTFAYPFGEVDDRISRIVETAGFCAAVTARPGHCQPGVDRLRLPRLMVDDWPAPVFEGFLKIAGLKSSGSLVRRMKDVSPKPVASPPMLAKPITTPRSDDLR